MPRAIQSTVIVIVTTILSAAATAYTHAQQKPAASGASEACSLLSKHLTPDMAAMYKALCAQKTKDGLTGLGDLACWYNEKHEELQVMKSGTFFSVELRKSGNPTEAIKGVARKVYDQVK